MPERIKTDRTRAILAVFEAAADLTYAQKSVLIYMVANAREYDGALYWDQGREALFPALGRLPETIGDEKAYEAALKGIERVIFHLKQSGLVQTEYPAVATRMAMYGINVPGSGFEPTFARRIRIA